MMLDQHYTSKTRGRDLRVLNRKLSIIAVGGLMGSATSIKGKIPGAAKWKAQGNFLFNGKVTKLLFGHWAMAQEEAQRCVKGWTKRERIILAWLYEHNHLYREVGKALRRFSAPPDVSNECKDSVHIIAKDRGVIALHNRVVPDEELGDVDNFFLECANAARVRQGNLDYTAAFPLKVRFTFPLLFPLGNFPTIDETEVDMGFFGRFNETQFLYHPDFQRMRSPKFGFVFQELLITTRLWLMNPAINRHKETAMYSGNQLLSEEDFPSGTLAVRKARGDAFSIHRREGNGHFFFTATAHLDKLATILAGDRDILESWLAHKNNNVTDADIEHAQNIVHQSCEALEGKGSLDDVLYRDPVAIDAAFRMKPTGPPPSSLCWIRSAESRFSTVPSNFNVEASSIFTGFCASCGSAAPWSIYPRSCEISLAWPSTAPASLI